MMFSGLNQIVIATFGEPATLKAAGGDVELRGIFGAYTAPNAVAAAGYADKQYTLAVAQADVDAHGIGLRQTVTVRGVDYQIIDRDNDVAGLSTLILRRY